MSDPFAGLGEPFTSITRELGFPAAGVMYATAEQLLQVSDLTFVDLTVKRWTAGGAPLNLRVRALSLAEQEQVDRASLIKIDGQTVKSEARFASATLKRCCVMPQLNDAQATALRDHNPAIIGAIVQLVWNVLSILDQNAIDSMVDISHPLPSADESADDQVADDNSGDDAPESFAVESADGDESARAADVAA